MFVNSLWDELNTFRRSFDQAFHDLYRSAAQAPADNEWTFAPPVETGWTDEFLNLRVVLPGVQEKDLKVSVQGNQLFISGERKTPETFGKDGQVYQRLSYGQFERAIQLPNGLDLNRLSAHLHDGVLDIRIPLAEATKPRQIPVTKSEAHKTLTA